MEALWGWSWVVEALCTTFVCRSECHICKIVGWVSSSLGCASDPAGLGRRVLSTVGCAAALAVNQAPSPGPVRERGWLRELGSMGLGGGQKPRATQDTVPVTW